MCCGRKKRQQAVRVPLQTFAGIAHECDLVALREIVPAASIAFRTTEAFGSRDVMISTVLPGAVPALHRGDGTVWLGMQVVSSSHDVSRDLGSALAAALTAAPGTTIEHVPTGDDRPRLQDVLAESTSNVVTHDSFNYWLTEADSQDADVVATLRQANEAIVPTDRLLSVEAAYWCRIGNREHLRWVLPDDEERVLDALSRLHAGGENLLHPQSRYLGAFRTHGVVAPVWDLPAGWTAEDTEDPAAQWFVRYTEALADTSALTSDQRRARAGMVSRQLTLR